MADQKDRIAFLKDALKNLATAVKEVSKGLIDLDKIIKTLKGETAQLSKNADKAAVSMGKTAEQTKKATSELKKNETQTKNNTKASKGFFAGIGKNLKTIISFYGAYQILNIAVKAFTELTIGSAKRAIALEKSLADLRAVAGLTANDISRLKTVVFETAGVTSLTAQEVVELQKQLAKLGSSTEEIENLTEPIALLSQALGEDAGGVAAVLKKTLNQFQATSEEADRFANVLTGAVNETALSLNDLGTGLSYVGPLGAQLGVSFEETATLLGILADNGFKASKAGTGLRNFFVAAAKDGRPFNEFLEEIGDRNLTAAESFQIFGKIGASQALVLGNNVEAFKELSEELGKSDRLFKANAVQMASTEGQLQLLSSAYDKLSTKLGDVYTQTEFFIGVLGILDSEAAATARAYKAIANATGDAADAIEELVVAQRTYSEGANKVVSDTQIINTAFDALGDQAEVSKEKFINAFQEEIKKTGDLREALINLTWNPTWTGEIEQASGAILKLLRLTGDRSKGLDNLYISQEANNDVVSRFNSEYAELSELTKAGINVDNEALILRQQMTAEITELGKQTFELGKKGKDLNSDEKERFEIITKRIALLKEIINNTNGLSVSEETLASKRKKQDKEDQERFKTDLSSYIERIKETEKAISDLPAGVSDKIFSQQIDLLDGFFGSSEDIIAQATERFGADSDFVKALIKSLNDAAQAVNVSIPEDPFAGIILDASSLEGFNESDIDGVTKVAKTLSEKLKTAFEDVKLADVIAEGLDKAAEAISQFNEVSLENTKGRLDAEKNAIENRYETENDIIKSQLDNQLITESQFRAKQKELQRAKAAEQNDIDKQIFEAEKKQDRQDATTNYLQSLASIIPNLIVYDNEGNPVKLAIKGAISAGLTTAAYGANLAAIAQKKFFPKKFADGGMVNGPSHNEGGVPFSVQGQGGYEMEGGEYIINKRAVAKNRALLDSINKSGISSATIGRYKYAQGGIVNAPLNESVDYLKAIAEATVSTAIQTSKPVRAYVSSSDLRTNETERRLRDRNDKI